jgi:hypothetical protein
MEAVRFSETSILKDDEPQRNCRALPYRHLRNEYETVTYYMAQQITSSEGSVATAFPECLGNRLTRRSEVAASCTGRALPLMHILQAHDLLAPVRYVRPPEDVLV